MRILLGSSSPRRKDILQTIFTDIDIVHPSYREELFPGEGPEAAATRIAAEKCTSLTQQGSIPGDSLLITADTIVACDEKIMGKPEDYQDALTTLRSLNGRAHRVITALSLFTNNRSSNAPGEITSSFETTRVRFKDVPLNVTELYLAMIEYHDKAGSYAIQDNGEMIIAGYEGSQTNIIGFPLRLFFRMLMSLGLIPELFL